MSNVFSDDSKYVSIVKKALVDNNTFNNFKREPDYNAILEHVSAVDGSQYLSIIKNESSDLLLKINDFKNNDKIGNPITYNYPEIGSISPTTLRYIKVASDLRKLFGDLSGFKVAEIGVGYGGQILIMDQIWKMSYCMFDLPDVLKLANKYLKIAELQRIKLIKKFTELDLVISNYAFSELDKSLQQDYIDNVLLKAKRGYLTMNCIDGYNLSELTERIPNITTLEENPKTGPNNYIIVWGL